MSRLSLPRPIRFVPAVTLLALGGSIALAGAGLRSADLTDVEEAETRATGLENAMDGDASPIADALAAVDEDVRIFDLHLSTLANPWFEGRVPGSQGMVMARQYVEDHFRQWGLEPAIPVEGSGVDGSGLSYRQPFDLGGTLEVTRAALAGLAGGAAYEFEAGEAFNVMGIGGSGEVTAGVTFVGYGIDNGPDGWSSFAADTDLTGEIAMMLRFEPMDEEGESLWSDRGWSRRAGFGNKMRSVLERGAAGVIIVNPPNASDPRARQLIEPGGGGSGFGEVPVVMMTPDAASSFLAKADPEGRTVEDLVEVANEGGRVVPLEGLMSIAAEMEREPLVAENVIGMLRGHGDLADEYIVVGGHLDHLGMGYFGSRSGAGELHPGADDNASGSAGVLLMAQRIADRWEELGDTPRRSILFMLFDGEESGLNGSRYYVQNPIAPAEDHVLMMNFDMIGRIVNGRLSVSGGNTAEGFGDWLQPYFDASPLEIVVPERMSGASDHTSFYRGGIPILFGIIADFHDDYHTPRDVAWRINRVGATHAVRLFKDIAMDYAVMEETFPFAGQGGQGRRPQAQAAAADEDRPTRMGIPVRFGIRPGTYDPAADGIPIAGVTDGSPAAEAGILAGDRLVRWDGRKITSVESWMELLMNHEPGDVVNVGVLRDGEERTIEVTLGAIGGPDGR